MSSITMVFSGNRHRTAEGKLVGCKTIKGGIPLTVQGVANVEVGRLTLLGVGGDGKEGARASARTTTPPAPKPAAPSAG
ncbi:MAG: hypothetical protein JXB32_20065 [Deltaproteobacteria bacterium]|nr:hypothetical protein [Deltaproteobacteria bacterium]